MPKHVARAPEYQGLIKLLSSFETGPFILRWGGNEQDRTLEVLEDEQWLALADLHKSTGARYMIGLNLRVRHTCMHAKGTRITLYAAPGTRC